MFVGIDPSTEDSVTNYSLCELKEGFGCDTDPNNTF